MPYSSGVYTAPSNSFNPAVSNTTIDPTDWIALLADLSTALSTAICKDGQTTTTAAIPFAAGILGTTTNDSATAGCIGELISSTIASGSAVSLVNIVSKNVTSISLTAGDWDVCGTLAVTNDATLTYWRGSVSTTTNTDGSDPTQAQVNVTTAASSIQKLALPTTRFSLAATTTVYLVADVGFSGNATAYGSIRARRVR